MKVIGLLLLTWPVVLVGMVVRLTHLGYAIGVQAVMAIMRE